MWVVSFNLPQKCFSTCVTLMLAICLNSDTLMNKLMCLAIFLWRPNLLSQWSYFRAISCTLCHLNYPEYSKVLSQMTYTFMNFTYVFLHCSHSKTSSMDCLISSMDCFISSMENFISSMNCSILNMDWLISNIIWFIV